ncbi:MAG: 50S ribosomal protein L3 [Candidatus Komeilibacteria bacterium CG_4_9_14_0_8_um_filter_36_9]|uniref:Large ribosomal subunit protein uL3 n=2 Tax=Candidatus Komeiliibacteriota TaxID=1817908 RepID=A0A2M8DQK1_9BACT|nr:MAG: 50S ribosomal protein L3 [Candidatus Komeilibacteria bacterium CG_4_10_14_0_8_um_filter_37_78]PJC01439.1 MAG: 50S ribosomal protein L3 [Candidatus Komeilibacteria bacterium CG_4_9_14_0_8_um_filter_36_9]
MKLIIGKKLNMTQIFTPQGDVLPVTIINIEPVTITQIKTKKNDGYQAIQIGAGTKKKVNKPQTGHLKGKNFRYVKECRMPIADLQVGDSWGVEAFSEGEKIKITGITKGKGFQGVVKRWGFRGSPASHGHKDQLRMPGSIGTTGPARVFKGMRMGGHMGNVTTSIKWLEIVKIDTATSQIYVKGAVPGARHSLLYIFSEGDLVTIKKAANDQVAAKETPEIEEIKEVTAEVANEETTASQEETVDQATTVNDGANDKKNA